MKAAIKKVNKPVKKTPVKDAGFFNPNEALPVSVKKIATKKLVPLYKLQQEKEEAERFQKTGLIKITQKSKFGGLSEIYQSMAIKFSLLKKLSDFEYEQITPGVKCRDFIGDVYSATFQKYSFAIYGMKWDGSKNSPDLDSVNLRLQFPNAEAKSSFAENLKFLHEIEDKNGIPRTKYIDNGNEKGAAGKSADQFNGVIFGDKAWLQNVLHISLYTFILRVFCYKISSNDWVAEISKQSTSDASYVKSIKKEVWEKVLNNLTLIQTKDFCGLSFSTDGTSSCHHNSGWISVAGKHSEMNYSTVKKNTHYLSLIEKGVFKETRF